MTTIEAAAGIQNEPDAGLGNAGKRCGVAAGQDGWLTAFAVRCTRPRAGWNERRVGARQRLEQKEQKKSEANAAGYAHD